MSGMPELFAFLTAASIARGGIFSCCRIGSRPVELHPTRNQRKALELRSPVKGTGDRVTACASQDAPAYAYCPARTLVLINTLIQRIRSPALVRSQPFGRHGLVRRAREIRESAF
jgi:hypothetical protein